MVRASFDVQGFFASQQRFGRFQIVQETLNRGRRIPQIGNRIHDQFRSVSEILKIIATGEAAQSISNQRD